MSTSSVSDFRLALRGLRRNPLFATVAIVSLALGIGANTAIFTLLDQLLLRKLPVKAPDELVMIGCALTPACRQAHDRTWKTPKCRTNRMPAIASQPAACG